MPLKQQPLAPAIRIVADKCTNMKVGGGANALTIIDSSEYCGSAPAKLYQGKVDSCYSLDPQALF
jgi:hypothetical protein